MHLIDKTHQEAMSFRRRLAFGLLCCQPQSIEVWAPPGDLLGRVKETFSLFNAEFVIEDPYGNIIYQIEGPPKLLCFCRAQELHLKVLSPDFISQQGSITRIWNTDISAFTQNVYFAEANLDVKVKALFLGAAFLMVLDLLDPFFFGFLFKIVFRFRIICSSNQSVRVAD